MSKEDKPTRPANPFSHVTGNPQKVSIGSLIADGQFTFSEAQINTIEKAIDAGNYQLTHSGFCIECESEVIILPYEPDLKLTKINVQTLVGSLAVQELDRMADADEIDVTLTKSQIFYNLNDVYVAADRAHKKFARSAQLQEKLYPEIDGRPIRFVNEKQYNDLSREGGADDEGRHYIFLEHPQEQIAGIDITENATVLSAPHKTLIENEEDDTEIYEGNLPDDKPEGQSPGHP